MTRRTFSEEYKKEALNLVSELGSFSKASKQLGVQDNTLRSWAKKYNFNLNVSKEENETSASLVEENRKLRKELEKQKKINNILSKAAAFFSQDHLK